MKNQTTRQTNRFAGLFVALPGFEPRLDEPKSHVLPLHHKAVRSGEIYVLRRGKFKSKSPLRQIFLSWEEKRFLFISDETCLLMRALPVIILR